MSKVVHPVEGVYLNDVPHAPLSVDAATARRLIRTAAFTADGPRVAEPVPWDGHPILDHYDPPAGTEPAEPEAPQNAGPLDSAPEV